MADATKDAPPPPMRYSCATQRLDGPPTVSPPQHKGSESAGSHTSSRMVIGYGKQYPRIGIQQKPLKMRWWTAESTFKSRDDAKYADSELKKAAEQWNRVGFGVEFEPTSDETQAHFRLVYEKDDDGGTRMKGFFPYQQATTDLRILPITFTPKRKANMHRDFLHELGHVIGLRHEFVAYWDTNWWQELVVDAASGARALEFGTPNAKSVMSYEDPPTLQQTDMDNVRAFYKLANLSPLGAEGYPITDYPPVLRKKSN